VQRTALHALKTLVTKHPGAALDAAGSGAAYAAKSVIADGAAAVKSGVAKIAQGLTPSSHEEKAAAEPAEIAAPEVPEEEPAPEAEPNTGETEAADPEQDASARTAADLDPEELQELAASLTDEEREALATLARNTSNS
jgi:hypothetical protein